MTAPLGSGSFGSPPSGGSEDPYVSALGRISGKLLSEDLIRHGIDLTFRNGAADPDILYIDVNNDRIGVNITPTTDLDVSGKIYARSNWTAVGSTATFDNVVFNSNGSVTSTSGAINIVPSGPASIEIGKSLTPIFEFKDNYIRANTTDTDIVINPDGTGEINIQKSTLIRGDLTVTGDINVDGNLQKNGNIIIGDQPLDVVIVQTDFTQSIIPGLDATYDLGSSDKFWDVTWIQGNLGADNANITNTIISEQLRITGNTISTINSNDPITLDSDTGNITIEDINFNQNTITNLLNTPLTLISTGIGYIQFTDENAFVIPTGTTAERGFTEVGETRWNTDLGYLECYDGSVYLAATGGGTVITPAIQQELSEIYTLIFG